jgi:hypothetical protein
MKVLNCDRKEEVELLSFSDIQQQEGVYARFGLLPNVRIIVIKNPSMHSRPTVIYFNKETLQLEGLAYGWESHEDYVKTDEQVCFSLK